MKTFCKWAAVVAIAATVCAAFIIVAGEPEHDMPMGKFLLGKAAGVGLLVACHYVFKALYYHGLLPDAIYRLTEEA